jgi:RNA polymerase sigma-70 factor (ECF subfamily)
MADDNKICVLIKSQDPEGLQLAVKHYSRLVYTVIKNILQSALEQDIEECAEDVFLSLWRSADRFDVNKCSLKTWIIMIARRRAIDTYRSLCKKEGTEPLYEDIPVKDMSPEENIISVENTQDLLKAIKRLDSKDRSLFYHRYYLCESCVYISHNLKQSPEAVRKRLWKIRQQLIKIVNEED